MKTTVVMAIFALSQGRPAFGSQGSLVLAGGGTLPAEARAEFFRLAGGKGKARIVVVPTAASAADNPAKHESFLRAWRDLGPASVDLLHSRDRKLSNDLKFVKLLQTATGVWMSGGDQNRLTASYGGTRVERELHRLLTRGGVIGGTSAGAAIVSDLMIVGGRSEARAARGFGLLKGIVVDQHFTERNRAERLRAVLAKNRSHAGLGIDEDTAAIVQGRTLAVMGRGTVTAIWPWDSEFPKKERILKSGEVLDMSTLCTNRREARRTKDKDYAWI